ncbi:phytochelatin synthase family protein [Aliiruegeria sabulilitoris]|uniref:phytochelatin synthase family protein n=1 Tax=Aliiruegeria sabulilitoris TaxID=1510458 RepID=UPI000835B01A|nr:phytochelatin synthase family protein [Aliiruegeria sabulilitoris]NDR58020.1 glutathione gamma-glutamylcysteinyltransferase [Pseudoruegeria sp. M32A2M]
MRLFLSSLFVLGTAIAVSAETLPLPESLIALNSDEGGKLLMSSEANADYFDLGIHFTNQVHPAFCGPATIAMVLNALEVERPKSDMTLGLGLFDQENVFTPETEAVKPRAVLERSGLTLDELAGMFGAHEVSAKVHHAEDSSLDAFRSAATASIEDDESFVLVNYLRAGIGQERGGHISPLGAYDADTDRFLILDVSRYKYPPVWVEAATLFGAMNTPDSDNNNRSRGYLLVSR